ncbi:MAG: hypothetical protein EBU08_10275 [Micrococcales bacterium]|nr:hypothetical protein [Micrococcales bacterium]
MATTNKYLKGDLPIAISTNVPTALVRYSREDFAASYAIGNTPWLSAASDNNRISRITTTYQKERIDQGTLTGEQSLTNWWLRSATSWHHGAGEQYYDADSSDLYRFYESNNIDPWTLGELKLLPATTNLTTSAASSPATVSGGTFYISGSAIKFYNGTSTTSTSLGTSTTAQTLTTDGTFAIVGANDGIYQVSTALAVTKLYSKKAGVTTQTVQSIAYVKDRIVAGVMHDSTDMHLYELARNPTSPPVTLTSGDVRFTFANTSIAFNSISELPGAIVVGYTQGAVSRVQMYTINPTSPTAAIVGPTIIAELPRGETLNQMRSYLNEYVILATTKGLRVGTIGTDGQSFTYGPLNVEGNVQDIALDETYVYCTRSNLVSGSAGLWRLNLGQTIDNGYAYAADLVTDSNVPNGLAFVGSTGLKFITSSSGTWVEHATNLAASGYLKSGLIRWGTGEKKQPVSLSIKSDPDSSGTLGFNVDDNADQLLTTGTIPFGPNTEATLASYVYPADVFQVTFNFTRSTTDATKGPTLTEWQIRALPAPLRSRTITIPLLCYEEERDPNGNTRVSSPWERIQYLESIEQNGGAVLYQDFTSGEERICVIRAIQFEQTAPPTFASGFGGIVTLQLQTIDTETVVS